ncbi:MAG: N-acetylmuramic acid 6-phosphate etherase [Acidobacteria bacterium]|nr:N-acetylmuramic acid 6-phosphate etherase [Acidobacteriota bacterium]MBI3664562.1 N-acetylmuramic acid 6-phosphate etherase [Acidobacteriota bacterium]
MKVHRQTPRITEQRNPRSRGLDLKSTAEILQIINREDADVASAVAREIPAIARAVDTIAAALRRGGRLIYAGAGTSGRLAVLDASECPPTFGVPPRMVQGVIAGGRRALVSAVEGAEDDAAQGARDLAKKKVSAKDVVVGLTASGSTPYVLGALRYARRRGAATIGVTCNRGAALERLARITIAAKVGPEVIAGSTRMKAGTAQKMVLNMLSTAAMVRLGYVYDNWMINVALTNKKLRRRGLRLLEEAAGASVSEAARAARLAGHDLRVALVMLKAGVDAATAKRRLKQAGGDLRKALESLKA